MAFGRSKSASPRQVVKRGKMKKLAIEPADEAEAALAEPKRIGSHRLEYRLTSVSD